MDSPDDGLLRKATGYLREHGPVSLMRTAYSRWLRRWFPRVRRGRHAGVATADRWKRLSDYLVPWEQVDDDWEAGIVRAHRQLTRTGDSVLIIGGGWGISLVAAREQVGDEGSVTLYEASRRQIDKLRETARINGIDDYQVRHCRVTTSSEVWDVDEKLDEGASLIEPEDLPEADVLEVDCEGAEFPILERLSIRPRLIIVEVHPDKVDRDAREIMTLLEGMGYGIAYRSGHDGVPLTEEDANTLLQPSGQRQLNNGGRAPVILGAVRNHQRLASDSTP